MMLSCLWLIPRAVSGPVSLQRLEKVDKAWLGVTWTFICSTREAEEVLLLSLSQAWSIEDIRAQPELLRETLLKNINYREPQRLTQHTHTPPRVS